MSDQLQSACLRYLVPFTYQGKFGKACEMADRQKKQAAKKGKTSGENAKLWQRKLEGSVREESDLYEYVRDEFLFSDGKNPLSREKCGCQWIHVGSSESRSKNGKGIAELLYFPNGIRKSDQKMPKSIPVKIVEEGLYLFRNGQGFFWYELELPWDRMNQDSLVRFQNQIRELNRGQSTVIWKKENQTPSYGIAAEVIENKKTGQQIRKYMSPFSFGEWVAGEISFLNPDFPAKRRSAYASMVRNSLQNADQVSLEILGDPEKLQKKNQDVPDKALLCTYCCFKQTEKGKETPLEQKQELSFHLTNGYSDSYRLSRQTAETIKQPYDNVLWYATGEGVSYLAWPDTGNQEVFQSLIPSKFRADYFTLYVKTLYQSYSLLLYAGKLQKEIMAERGNNQVSMLFEEINLFLAKSMATSVSHIHHQSEFYSYLKEQLKIREDVESVTAGLNALDGLNREQQHMEAKAAMRNAEILEKEKTEKQQKRDAHIQAGIGFISVLAILTAFGDVYDYLLKFIPGVENGWTELTAHPVIFGIQLAAVVLIIIFGIFVSRFLYRAYQDTKEDRRREIRHRRR